MIYLRGHHLLCLQHFIGKGYNTNFINNIYKILRLLNDDTIIIKIISGADVICKYCPNNINNRCRENRKISLYDKKVFELIGIDENTVIKYKECKDLIFKKIITQNKLSFICSDCGWFDVCSNFYK